MAASKSDPLCLDYNASVYVPPTGRRPQSVLLGRSILTPDLDLNDYSCSAVIDWLEFRFCTQGEHQALNIQRVAMDWLSDWRDACTVYVSGPQREPRYQGQNFFIRVQDPKPRSLYYLLSELRDRYSAAPAAIGDTQISGIEIAVDFRVSATRHEPLDERVKLRLQMSDMLRRHIRPAPVLTDADRHWPRFYKELGGRQTAQYWVDTTTRVPSALVHEFLSLGLDSRHAAALSLGAHHQPPIDTTSYIGAKESPIFVRIMDKTTDRRDPEKKHSVSLPDNDHRSRIEVSLIGAWDELGGAGAIGLQTIRDLYGFDFQSYRKPLFEFFLPTIDLGSEGRLPSPAPSSLTELAVLERSGVYGLDRVHRSLAAFHQAQWEQSLTTHRPARLGKKGRLVSYSELNQKVDRALKALSRTWETPSIRLVGSPGAKHKAA